MIDEVRIYIIYAFTILFNLKKLNYNISYIENYIFNLNINFIFKKHKLTDKEISLLDTISNNINIFLKNNKIPLNYNFNNDSEYFDVEYHKFYADDFYINYFINNYRKTKLNNILI